MVGTETGTDGNLLLEHHLPFMCLFCVQVSEDQTCGAAVGEAVVAGPPGTKEEASPLREEGGNGGVDSGKGEGVGREFEEEEERADRGGGVGREFEEEEEKADSRGRGVEGEGVEEEGEAVAASTGLMDAL